MYLRGMVKLFLGNRTGVLFLIPFFMLGYFLLDQFTSYYPHNAQTNIGMWGISIPFSDSFLEISGAILVVMNALAINMIYNANEFLERNSYIPSLLYVVMMLLGMQGGILILNGRHLYNLFMLGSVRKEVNRISRWCS